MGKLSKALRWVFGIIGISLVIAAVAVTVYIIINLNTILALIAAAMLIGGM